MASLNFQSLLLTTEDQTMYTICYTAYIQLRMTSRVTSIRKYKLSTSILKKDSSGSGSYVKSKYSSVNLCRDRLCIRR